MTIQLPVAPPHLFTVAEYLEFGEPELGYSELVEGRLVMSPSPIPTRSLVCSEGWVVIRGQLPPHLAVVQDVDVDLQLVRPDEPGFCRRPDLIVVTGEALRRVEREGGVLRASEVLVAIEVVSRGSKRIDHVVKRGEYADAGIPHYWIIDMVPRTTLLACRMTDGPPYVDGGAVTGVFTATAPFAVEIDLDSLV